MRGSKAGWEEAGAEFYQESYPAGSDWDQRDPATIATLLPSKQNRFGEFKEGEGRREKRNKRPVGGGWVGRDRNNLCFLMCCSISTAAKVSVLFSDTQSNTLTGAAAVRNDGVGGGGWRTAEWLVVDRVMLEMT